MELIKQIIDLFLHLDKYMGTVIAQYGWMTYLLLYLIVFLETGLVVTPFLPGDSLLFAAGTFAARGYLELSWLIILLSIAAIIGDTVNYWIGHYMGPRVFGRFLNQEHLVRTEQFYEKYGAKTIIIARFVPIVRTFAPFVAGIGKMNYGRFISYNVIGGIAWVLICVLAGYFFGNIPMVQKNFTFVILAIIFISILPGIIEVWRQRQQTSRTS
jgi:membrane-associated protein